MAGRRRLSERCSIAVGTHAVALGTTRPAPAICFPHYSPSHAQSSAHHSMLAPITEPRAALDRASTRGGWSAAGNAYARYAPSPRWKCLWPDNRMSHSYHARPRGTALKQRRPQIATTHGVTVCWKCSDPSLWRHHPCVLGKQTETHPHIHATCGSASQGAVYLDRSSALPVC